MQAARGSGENDVKLFVGEPGGHGATLKGVARFCALCHYAPRVGPVRREARPLSVPTLPAKAVTPQATVPGHGEPCPAWPLG